MKKFLVGLKALVRKQSGEAEAQIYPRFEINSKGHAPTLSSSQGEAGRRPAKTLGSMP